MNILIDLQHPAHLHVFRNAATLLESRGHRVRFTGWDKDILAELAQSLGREVEIFGRPGRGVAGMALQLLRRQYRLAGIIRRFRPDVMLAVAGTFIAPLGAMFRIPAYVFYDTEHATMSNAIAYPCATCIYVPRAYRKAIAWRHERYPGYHELAYLHPNRFTPDPGVLAEAGLAPGERFSIVRFVGWNAAHDFRHQGLGQEWKTKAVRLLQQHGRVFISSEAELSGELAPYRLGLSISRLHDLMAFSSLVFGESGTMSSEAAVLGVPAVYINPLELGYLREQEERFGLVANFRPDQAEAALARAGAMLASDPAAWRDARQRLLDETIDLTPFIVDVAENRPHSRRRR